MSSLLPDRRIVNVHQQFESALSAALTALRAALGTRMSHLLAKDLDELLGRERYVRRGHVRYDVEGGECHRCHSRESRRFSRHGSRLRTATTRWGDLQIRWPRARCQCGGCVKLNLAGWLAAYQRLDDAVDAQIQRWGGLNLSLRQMQNELKHTYIGPLALRTLNRRLHQLQELTPDLVLR